MSGNGSLHSRLAKLEAQSTDLQAYRRAERLCQLYGGDPGELLAEASKYQALAQRIGRQAAIEQMAADAGVTGEQVEAEAANMRRRLREQEGDIP